MGSSHSADEYIRIQKESADDHIRMQREARVSADQQNRFSQERAAERQKLSEQETRRAQIWADEKCKTKQIEAEKLKTQAEDRFVARCNDAQVQQLVDARVKGQLQQQKNQEEERLRVQAQTRKSQEESERNRKEQQQRMEQAQKDAESSRRIQEEGAKIKRLEQQQRMEQAQKDAESARRIKEEEAKIKREALKKREDDELEEKKKCREEERKFREEARKLIDNEALQSALKDKASQAFGEFNTWPEETNVIKMTEHHVVLTYDQLDPDVVAPHCATMFSELPQDVKQELTRMAENAMAVIRSSRQPSKAQAGGKQRAAGGHVSEIVDCKKSEVSFNVGDLGYSARYSLAFRFVEITEATAKQAGWLDWFKTSHPDGKSSLVGVAYKFECAASKAKSLSVDKSQMEAWQKLGLV